MSRDIGRKHPEPTEEKRQLMVERAAHARKGQIRFRNGRFSSSQQIKAALSESAGKYLARIDALVDDKDPRIALDAARYLIDRIAGRPTEKIAGDEDGQPVRFESLNPQQFSELAGIELKRRRGEDDTRSEDPQSTEQPEEVN